MLEDLVQVAGSLLILSAFVLAQSRRVNTTSRIYLWLNLAGSLVLAVLAAKHNLWGFLLLETVWAAVSARGLLSSSLSRHDVLDTLEGTPTNYGRS